MLGPGAMGGSGAVQGLELSFDVYHVGLSCRNLTVAPEAMGRSGALRAWSCVCDVYRVELFCRS